MRVGAGGGYIVDIYFLLYNNFVELNKETAEQGLDLF